MSDIYIGIDIGGTNASIGFVSEDGSIIFNTSEPIKQFKTAEDFVDFFSDIIEKQKDSLNLDGKIKGIGIGAPNGNFYTGSIEDAPNLDWNGIIPMAKMFQEKTGIPARLTNDANAAAIGEMIYGNAKGMNDFLMVTLGTGVGSGFVANRKLILGHDGFAGELGHTIYDPNGRKCGCGRCGCLETYTSATGIVRTAKEKLTYTETPSLLRNLSEEELTSKAIYDAAIEGDSLALEIFDFTAEVLGFSLANAVAITSPEAIFLFGGLAQSGDLIIKPTKKYMEKYLLSNYKDKVDIIPSGLHENNAAILGAAAIAK